MRLGSGGQLIGPKQLNRGEIMELETEREPH